MKDVLSRGRTIDCFLSIATVLRGILRHDVKTPLLSDLFLAASCISWSDFRSHASTEIGPREHARARSPGVTHSSPPQKVARSPTSPNGARSRTCTRRR